MGAYRLATKWLAVTAASCAGVLAYCLSLPMDQVSFAFVEARKNVWRLSRWRRRSGG